MCSYFVSDWNCYWVYVWNNVYKGLFCNCYWLYVLNNMYSHIYAIVIYCMYWIMCIAIFLQLFCYWLSGFPMRTTERNNLILMVGLSGRINRWRLWKYLSKGYYQHRTMDCFGKFYVYIHLLKLWFLPWMNLDMLLVSLVKAFSFTHPPPPQSIGPLPGHIVDWI